MMIHSPPTSLAPSSFSSPESTSTILGSSSASSSSGSSTSTVRRDPAASNSSPKSFTVTRHPRKVLLLSVSTSTSVAGSSRGDWSPSVSSPLASPYGSPPTSPLPLLLDQPLSNLPAAERKKSVRKRRCPASPSATIHGGPSRSSAGSSTSRSNSSEAVRPGPQSTTSSPGTANGVLRVRPVVRRAASANNVGKNEWQVVELGGVDKISQVGQGHEPSVSTSSSRPSSTPNATQELDGPLSSSQPSKNPPPVPPSLVDLQRSTPAAPLNAFSPASLTLSPSTLTSGTFTLPSKSPTEPSRGMQLLPSPSTFKVSSITSPGSQSTFEDYFNPARGSHPQPFNYPPKAVLESPWNAGDHVEPPASRSQLTIRIEDGSTTDQQLPELEHRSPTTPLAQSSSSQSWIAYRPVAASSPAHAAQVPHMADPERTLLPPPRLIRKRSSSDPTPSSLIVDTTFDRSSLIGKALPPLPSATDDHAFGSSSASSCSSSASCTSRATDNTALTVSSNATTTEPCETPPSSVLGLGFDTGEPTIKGPTPVSKRRSKIVEGSAIETDSEGEEDRQIVTPVEQALVDSPMEVVRGRTLAAGEPREARGSVSEETQINTRKASKLACQLWDLVEGEVAYTDDLVTLVQIYLHHLFMMPFFTVERRDAVARNTLDLLVLHKRFTQSLVAIASQEHLRSPEDKTAEVLSDADLDRAARRIARVFVEEADDFAAYQDYCTGHDDALAVIRQHELTLQWMEYERKCSALSDLRPRTSLVNLMETVSSPPALGSRRSSWKWPSAPSTPQQQTVRDFADPSRKQSRLMLRDLLIKPIQRICRYPLILDSMRTTKVVDLTSGEERTTGGQDLEDALAVMKVVAGSVDEATRRKVSLERSRVIRDRIEAHPTLSRGVLGALGECLLVGSFDVVYHHHTIAPLSTPVKIRYLPAFLYAGFFVLCKAKKGKSYTPLHYLPLDRLEITDAQSGKNAYLPDSIRLQGEGYFLEVSAACTKEKEIWLLHLRKAQASETLALKSPPTSAPEIFTSRTITRRQSHGASLAKPTVGQKRHSGSLEARSLEDELTTMEHYVPSSVSSTPATSPRNSVVGSTLPIIPSQVLFLRSPPSYREAVDKALADVMSESCSTARNKALLEGVNLFAPSSHKTATSSSSSIGTAVSSVRRKMANQSGSMRRRSSFLDVNGQFALLEDQAPPNATSTSSSIKLPRTKSEVGLKRESFLRRSSLMTHWPTELKTTALPPVPALPPTGKSPSRSRSDRTRSRTAPPTPIMGSIQYSPPEKHESPMEMESPSAGTTAAIEPTPSTAPSPVKPKRSKSTAPTSRQLEVPDKTSRRSSVVDSWFNKNQASGLQKPLSPILSPALGDTEIHFPRQSVELPPSAFLAPEPTPILVREPRTSALRRSLTSTFSRRKSHSALSVPDTLTLSRSGATAQSSDGIATLVPISPVSPLELCGEFGAISSGSASSSAPATTATARATGGGGGTSRPSFFLKSRSSSFASDSSGPDMVSMPSSSASSAPTSPKSSSTDVLDPDRAPSSGPVRRKSSRSVRFLKSFNFTPVS